MLDGMALALVGVAALVVCGGGVVTLRRPEPVRQALGARGVRVGPGSVRAIALGELAIGLGALAPRTETRLALGVLYLAYAAFTASAARRSAPCGCLGAVDEPASLGHAAVDLVVGVGVIAAALRTPELPSAASLAVVALLVVVGAVALGAVLRPSVVAGATR